MLKYLKEYRFYIILGFFILIPILSIDTATRAPRDYWYHDRAIVAITSPIQATIRWVLDGMVGALNDYVFLLSIRKDNLVLLEENRKLVNTIVSLREAQEENNRLRNVLSFKEDYKLDGILARVIAKDVSTEFRTIRINRGAKDGIVKDMAVVNNEGVVGRVLRTTNHHADVVTILDLLSAVDAIDKRSRARGIVEGMTDDLCQLKFALRTDDIAPGDLLISSGFGGILPKGVPVGTVARVDRKPYGITQTVEVRPSVDFSRLEEVFVITKWERAPIHVSTDFRKFSDEVTSIKSSASLTPAPPLAAEIKPPLAPPVVQEGATQ